jgi:23S rRNA (adenine2503-C2)-methyltransferase
MEQATHNEAEVHHYPAALTTYDGVITKAPQAPVVVQNSKPSLVGLDMEELTAALTSVGLEPYRAKQVWNWIYARGAKTFDEMTNIAKAKRPLLEEHFTIARPEFVKDLTSVDGTRKWLLGFPDGNKVESVFIPETERGALCISSQVGCTLSCSFCHTGTMPLVRNLKAGEIVSQILVARDGLNEWNVKGEDRIFTNIVLMGMGEPLFNYDNVAKALRIIMDTDGIAMSKRRITLSTSGVVPMIERVGVELGVNLAISLHAVRDDLRNVLVPLNKKYPIKELLEACKKYPGANNARRITFEYVMLKGVNDTDADAKELVRLLKGIHAKVNLIPFNPWPGSDYECSDDARIHEFAEIVYKAGYIAPIRTPRGRDIFAACGQLKSDSERKKGQKIEL